MKTSQPSDSSPLTYASDLSGHGVGSLVRATDHHLVDDDLLRPQNDPILAHHSADRTIIPEHLLDYHSDGSLNQKVELIQGWVEICLP